MVILKRLLLVCLLLFTLSPVAFEAQAIKPIRFGLRGGIQTQDIRLLGQDDRGRFAASEDLGYQFGMVCRVSLLNLYLQPELTYSSSRFTLNDRTASSSTRVKMRNVEFPVLLGGKFLFLRIFGGPVFNLLDNTGDGNPDKLNARFYRQAVRYQLGAGVELGHIGIDARYGGQFQAAARYVDTGKTQVKVNSRFEQWQLNLIYFF